MKLIEPKVFGDERGFFLETWRADLAGRRSPPVSSFVQDNHSRSAKGVLRGLHYQLRQPQGKLVRVIAGAVFDVAVDMRRARRPSAAGSAPSCQRREQAHDLGAARASPMAS